MERRSCAITGFIMRYGVFRARGLPFEDLHRLPGERDPWVAHGPVGPRNAIVAGSWFMMREIELSTARAALLELCRSGPQGPTVRWHFPASKPHPRALGVARAHGCLCRGGPPQTHCPAHAVWDQILMVKALFPKRWRGELADWDLPLCTILRSASRPRL